MALAVILPELFAKTDALIDDAGQRKLLTEIELPLAGVLARMECAGFDVDKAGIEAFSKKLSTRISTLTDEIFEAVGHEFNINSPKQLGVALFEDLGLPCKKKDKKRLFHQCRGAGGSALCPPGGGKNHGISHTD